MSADERQVGGKHYKALDPKQEHWNLVTAYEWDYFQAQIIKYVMRHKSKNGMQDLQKAQHFLEKYIELNTVEEPVAPKYSASEIREQHKKFTSRLAHEGEATSAYVNQ